MRERKRKREDVRASQPNTLDFFFSFSFFLRTDVGNTIGRLIEDTFLANDK
jgi:hypothetical protein